MGREKLISLIGEKEGWLSWEEFMGYALYDAEEGYYAKRISCVGRRGDFSTAATLSGMPARALIARYRQACTLAGETLSVIEMGGGDGSLAGDMWRELRFWERWRISYHMVETSPVLRELQRKKMGRAITHFDHPGEALASCKGKAFIFSNELVDAFPVRIFRCSAEGWQELGVSWKEGKLLELWRTVGVLPDSSLFRREYAVGQRVEVHESFDRWCDDWAFLWKAGEMVTIDYGAAVEDLYYRRPAGSIRGYMAHNRLEGKELYAYPGRMDLTCDVNFTDLMEWGRKRGWETERLLYQGDFFSPFSSGSESDRFLTNPAGAGRAFMVLVQRPGGKIP